MTHHHDHPHGEHDHVHPHEHYSARPHPETVVLEIGDDLGAAIVYTDAELHGREIEISPSGADTRREHKDVLERQQGGSPAFTAVFDRIVEGEYTFWLDDVALSRDVKIEGGAITELDWRSSRVPAAASA
jgi:hypothetical protein